MLSFSNKEILVKEKKYKMSVMKVFREDIKIDLTVTAMRTRPE